MERYSEVGKHSVNPVHVIVAHEVCDKAEVGVYHGEAVIFHGSFHRILVLIEGVEMSPCRSVEMLYDGSGMSSPSVGGIDVYSPRLDVKGFNAFGEQCRDMIYFF